MLLVILLIFSYGDMKKISSITSIVVKWRKDMKDFPKATTIYEWIILGIRKQFEHALPTYVFQIINDTLYLLDTEDILVYKINKLSVKINSGMKGRLQVNIPT